MSYTAASDDRLLASLDRAFAAHAGPDGRIAAAELRGVLGLRTDALAQRVFAQLDTDRDGAISREEFIATVQQLVAGSTHDKLAFAFRLHDEDGDGAIVPAELSRMIALGLAEDDVALAPERVTELVTGVFARADANRDGRITLAELEAVAAHYPHLIAQMTRSEARWIAPNEDLLARFAPDAPAPRGGWMANRRGAAIAIALWAALHVALFASAFLGPSRGTPAWLGQLGNACTTCLQIDIGLVLLLALRRLLTRLRATRLGHALPIDDAIAFHRVIGYAILVFALGHGAARFVGYLQQTKRTLASELLSLEGLTGLLLVAFLVVMGWFAREAVRRSHRFEQFYFTHLLYLPFLVLAAIHAPAILAASGVGIAGLAIEHLLRLRRRGTRAEVVSAAALRSGVTRLELARPPGFAAAPADYVFLRVPEVARHEWHPFTLSSAPEASSLVVHVRSLGNWTRALRERVQAGGPPLTAYLDGPYGSPSRHLFQARFAVMIGAGIGVTPFASVLESIALRPTAPAEVLEKAHFYWLARDRYSFEWFAALLASLEAKPHADRLDLHMYMTGGNAGLSAAGLEVARELLAESGGADLITGLQTKTHVGHPDWDAELGRIAAAHAPAHVQVFFCGPEGLGRIVARAAARHGMTFRDEKF